MKSLQELIKQRKPSNAAIAKDIEILEKFDEEKMRKYHKNLAKAKAITNDSEKAKHAAIRYVNQRKARKASPEQLINLAKAREIKEKKNMKKEKIIEHLKEDVKDRYDINFVKKDAVIEVEAEDKYKKLVKSIEKKAKKHGVNIDTKHLAKLHDKIKKYEEKKINKEIQNM